MLNQIICLQKKQRHTVDSLVFSSSYMLHFFSSLPLFLPFSFPLYLSLAFFFSLSIYISFSFLFPFPSFTLFLNHHYDAESVIPVLHTFFNLHPVLSLSLSLSLSLLSSLDLSISFLQTSRWKIKHHFFFIERDILYIYTYIHSL